VITYLDGSEQMFSCNLLGGNNILCKLQSIPGRFVENFNNHNHYCLSVWSSKEVSEKRI
jgi:hypothetical protein